MQKHRHDYRNQRILKHPETSKEGKIFGQKVEVVSPGRPREEWHLTITIIKTGHSHPANHGAKAGRDWEKYTLPPTSPSLSDLLLMLSLEQS